jgi:predicted glycosyltransferase
MGLGHIRRNLLIAQALAYSHLEVDILVLTGAREFGSFHLPPDIDCIVLPSLYKEQSGEYRSRHLDISLDELVALRRNTLFAAITGFEPDVLIVDNVPGGAQGELLPVLDYLRSQTKSRCVLGMRDIRDSPRAVEFEWRREGAEEVLRSLYDEIWIYGDPAVYDPVSAYGLSGDVAAKVRFLGYLDQRERLRFAETAGSQTHRDVPLPADDPYVLCMVGGGQDGWQLAQAFAQVCFPEGTQGVLVCGPHMDCSARRVVHRYASLNRQVQVLDFVPEPTHLVRSAEAVICMGGYNSVCEALSFGKRTLLVPRVKPRKEQLIRAQRLAELGVADMLLPDMLGPRELGARIRDMLTSPPVEVHHHIDFGAINKLPSLVEELLRIDAAGGACLSIQGGV